MKVNGQFKEGKIEVYKYGGEGRGERGYGSFVCRFTKFKQWVS